MRLPLIALAAIALPISAMGLTSLRSADRPEFVDPCRAINTADLSAIVGTQMKPGLITGTKTGCQYRSVVEGGPSVMINVEQAETVEASQLAAIRAGATVTDLADGGFVAASPNGRTHSAEAVKGEFRYRALVEDSFVGSPIAIKTLGVVMFVS